MKQLLIFLFGYMLQAQQVESRVLVSNQDLHEALNTLPKNMAKHFGLNNQTDIDMSYLGSPIRVGAIDSNGGLTYYQQWRIPVLVNNSPKLLVTINKTSTEDYKIIDFGAVELSKELFNLRVQNKPIDLLIRNYTNKIDFVSVQSLVKTVDVDTPIIIPLKSAKKYLSNHDVRTDKISVLELLNLSTK